MSNNRYNIFQAIFMSFYSKNLYRDVANNWGGKAFFYLLILLMIVWIPFTMLTQTGLSISYKLYSPVFVQQVPLMTIKNGIISTPENKPYFITIRNNKTLETIAIIDTSGKYKSLQDANVGVLVTKNQIMTRSNDEIKIRQLPENLNTTFDAKKINFYIGKFLNFAWIFIYIFFIAISFLYRIIQGLLFAIIGKFFNFIVEAPLSYGQILQIVMVAITPAIVLSTIVDLIQTKFNHWLAFYFILTMAYLFFGIHANKVKPNN